MQYLNLVVILTGSLIMAGFVKDVKSNNVFAFMQRKTSDALTKLLSLQAVTACLMIDGRLVTARVQLNKQLHY